MVRVTPGRMRAHLVRRPHSGRSAPWSVRSRPSLFKAQLLIETDGSLVVGKDLQLHPHQHEPVVRQIQQCFHQGGAHTPALVVRMHKEAHRAHMAHPGIGADREAGAAITVPSSRTATKLWSSGPSPAMNASLSAVR